MNGPLVGNSGDGVGTLVRRSQSARAASSARCAPPRVCSQIAIRIANCSSVTGRRSFESPLPAFFQRIQSATVISSSSTRAMTSVPIAASHRVARGHRKEPTDCHKMRTRRYHVAGAFHRPNLQHLDNLPKRVLNLAIKTGWSQRFIVSTTAG